MDLESVRRYTRFCLTYLLGFQIFFSILVLVARGFGAPALVLIWLGIPGFYYLMKNHRQVFNFDSEALIFVSAAILYTVLPGLWPVFLLVYVLTFVYDFTR